MRKPGAPASKVSHWPSRPSPRRRCPHHLGSGTSRDRRPSVVRRGHAAAEEVIQVGADWYVHAASALADDSTFVLKHDDTFAIFDRYGDIQPIGLGGASKASIELACAPSRKFGPARRPSRPS